MITWAARRGGYRRQPSPLIAGIDTGDVGARPAAARAAHRAGRPRPHARRARSRGAPTPPRGGILPAELCSDRDLHAIAAARPTTADDLAAVTSFGLLTATRPAARRCRDAAGLSAAADASRRIQAELDALHVDALGGRRCRSA